MVGINLIEIGQSFISVWVPLETLSTKVNISINNNNNNNNNNDNNNNNK